MKKLFVIFAILFLGGCSKASHPSTKPIILVTIAPYAEMVERLVGTEAQVEIFVPAGANPHTYEPTAQQLLLFSKASIWFRIGDPIEQKMVHLFKEQKKKIVNLSKGRAFLYETHCHHHNHHHSHDGKDLHLWMDPQIVVSQVKQITTSLIQLLPHLSSSIEQQRNLLIHQLEELDHSLLQRLVSLKNRTVIVSHPSLGYFCARYQLHQLSIEIEGKDPLPHDVASLVEKVQKEHVKLILTQPQYSDRAAFLLASKFHLAVESFDPYQKNYFDMMQHLSRLLVKYDSEP